MESASAQAIENRRLAGRSLRIASLHQEQFHLDVVFGLVADVDF
jgi:hypothetical protein